MSTTIYNGKRLPDMSVYQMNQFYKSLRRDLIGKAQLEYQKLIAKVAQEIYVYLQTGVYIGDYDLDLDALTQRREEFQEDKLKLVKYAFDFINEAIRKTSTAKLRCDCVNGADLDVSVVILPIQDKTLCIPYANHDILNEALLSREEFIEYGYWDNTDPPAELHDYEWHQRKCDWDEALPGIGIPQNNGMVLRIVDAVNDVIGLSVYEAIEYFNVSLMKDEDVLELIAKRVITHREFERLYSEANKNDGDGVSSAMKCLFKASDYYRAHPEEAEVEKNNYRNQINSPEFFSDIAELAFKLH